MRSHYFGTIANGHLAGLILVLVLLVASRSALAADSHVCLNGSGEERVEACSRIIQSGGAASWAYTNRGRGYLQKGDYDRAISDLNEAVRLDPTDPVPIGLRGSVYQSKGDLDRALSDASEAVRLAPQDWRAYATRGDFYRLKGDLARSISDLDRALSLDQGHAFVYKNRGEVYWRKGDYDRAISDLNEAVRLDPADPVAIGLRSTAYLAKGDLDRALSDANEAVRLGPQDWRTYAGRGDIYRLKGDLASAISDANEALRLNPKAFLALASRGDAYRQKGDYDRAISDLDEALRLNPKYSSALATRGEAYRQKGDYERAISDFDNAINVDPQNTRAISLRDDALRTKAWMAARAPSKEAGSVSTITPPASSNVTPRPAGRRVALVIGNGNYRKMPGLANPVNDASDIGDALKQVGFDVQVEINADRARLNEAMSRFSNKVAGADVAIFYYAGHGMQFLGKNFLLPVDADLQSFEDVNKFKLLLVDDVIDVMGTARGLQLVVLDACRNNPVEQDFKRRIAPMSGSREVALDRGFARIDTRSGLMLAYATSPNSTAADGNGRNSPFTAAFLDNLKVPNLGVRQLLYQVQDQVYRATEKKQIPEISSLYIGPDPILRAAN